MIQVPAPIRLDEGNPPTGETITEPSAYKTLTQLRQSFVGRLPDAPAGPCTSPAEIPPVKPAPIAIMGIPFDNINSAQALQAIDEMVASGGPHYLVTANVDFLVQAHEDVELRRILVEADLVLCDGTPLVWVSRLLGNPLPERVAGADLAPLLIELAAEKGHRLFLLGATEDSCSQAAANLQRQYPKLLIAGHYSPPFKQLLEMDHDEIVRRIQQAKPDLLLVSFGCPKQEKWIAMHYRALGVPVCAGVGATIDFLAGKVKRAPVWMRRSGLEWIFRLLQEPRRLFRRYARDLWVFAGCILKQWWQLQLCTHLRSNRSDASDLSDLSDVQRNRDHRLLDLSHVKFLDSTSVGRLIRLRRDLRAKGNCLVLIASRPAVRRALSLVRLQEFFDYAPDHQSARRLIENRLSETSAAVITSRADPSAEHNLIWQGEVTAANAETVWESTHARLLLAARGRMVIDLSAVRFIDSSGLGLMVRARKLAQQSGINLIFTKPQTFVLNVIHIARLEELLLS